MPKPSGVPDTYAWLPPKALVSSALPAPAPRSRVMAWALMIHLLGAVAASAAGALEPNAIPIATGRDSRISGRRRPRGRRAPRPRGDVRSVIWLDPS